VDKVRQDTNRRRSGLAPGASPLRKQPATFLLANGKHVAGYLCRFGASTWSGEAAPERRPNPPRRHVLPTARSGLRLVEPFRKYATMQGRQRDGWSSHAHVAIRVRHTGGSGWPTPSPPRRRCGRRPDAECVTNPSAHARRARLSGQSLPWVKEPRRRRLAAPWSRRSARSTAQRRRASSTRITPPAGSRD